MEVKVLHIFLRYARFNNTWVKSTMNININECVILQSNACNPCSFYQTKPKRKAIHLSNKFNDMMDIWLMIPSQNMKDKYIIEDFRAVIQHELWEISI